MSSQQSLPLFPRRCGRLAFLRLPSAAEDFQHAWQMQIKSAKWVLQWLSLPFWIFLIYILTIPDLHSDFSWFTRSATVYKLTSLPTLIPLFIQQKLIHELSMAKHWSPFHTSKFTITWDRTDPPPPPLPIECYALTHSLNHRSANNHANKKGSNRRTDLCCSLELVKSLPTECDKWLSLGYSLLGLLLRKVIPCLHSLSLPCHVPPGLSKKSVCANRLNMTRLF